MINYNEVIEKKLTPPKNFFKWCLQQIPTYEWSNKEKTILASERKDCEVIKKRLTKKSRLSLPEKFYSFAIVLVSKNRIEIQSYSYWREIENGKETLTTRMTNFEQFSNDQHLKATFWCKGWFEGLSPNYVMCGPYTNTNFYPNQWNEHLKNNKDMKYLDLPKLLPSELPRIYKYRKEYEFLTNIKATNLAFTVLYKQYDYMNVSYLTSIDMRIVTKSWLKANKQILKEKNPSFNELMLELELKKRKITNDKELSSFYNYRQLMKIPIEINLRKLYKWITENDVSFDYYLDYVSMLKELNISCKDTQVAFPKEIEVAHDNAVGMVNQLKRELKEKAYEKRYLKAKKLERDINEFVFIVPKELQEIIDEGTYLHHCVGSKKFLDDQLKGKTNIIFIRKKDDINTPYFTLEYRQKRVKQVQGKKNRQQIPDNVQQAIDKWQQVIQKVS